MSSPFFYIDKRAFSLKQAQNQAKTAYRNFFMLSTIKLFLHFFELS